MTNAILKHKKLNNLLLKDYVKLKYMRQKYMNEKNYHIS